MTTTLEMEIAYAVQAQVIAILHENGDFDLADRLTRCMRARQERYFGTGWPFSCRNAGCFFCHRAMVRGWSAGFRDWAQQANAATLAIIRIPSTIAIFEGVRWLRRGLRDVRDRTARRKRAWRPVCFGGLACGDARALIMIPHDGVSRQELYDTMSNRWPDLVLQDVADEQPSWEMTSQDAADLGMRRRGIEPLRISIMTQRATRVAVTSTPVIVEPMPVVI